MADPVIVQPDGGYLLQLPELTAHPTGPKRNGVTFFYMLKNAGAFVKRFGRDPENFMIAQTPDSQDAILELRRGAANGVASLDAGAQVPLSELPAGLTGDFIGLTDTPSSYVGKATRVLRVNAGESAVEFLDQTTDWLDQYLNKNGRAGGQVWTSGTGAADPLTLRATSNSIPGAIILESEPDVEVVHILPTGEVGIGITPGVTSMLHVLRSVNADSRIVMQNLANGANAKSSISTFSPTASVQMTATSALFSGISGQEASAGHLLCNGNFIIATLSTGNDILFKTGATITERFRILSVGGLVNGLGEGGTTLATGNILRAPDLSGGTDIAGAILTIGGGEGRGITPGSKVVIQTARVQVSGSLAQTRATLMTLDEDLVAISSGVDGEYVGLLIENSQPNVGASTNETSEIRFGFGGNTDVARISVTKKGDYTIPANEKSALRFWVDIAGTDTQVLSVLNSGISLGVPASKLDFNGDAGGGGQGIRYKDAGGSLRSALAFPGSDVVALSNQAANGTVEIRANTSTAGSGGEVTVATFADTEITSTVPVIATNLKAHALIENRSPSASQALDTFATLASASAVTFSGRPVLCFVSVTMFPSEANIRVELAIQIDSGSDVVAAQLNHNEQEHNPVVGAVIVTPTAGSHTLRIRWRRAAGSGTLTLDANDQILLHAVEL